MDAYKKVQRKPEEFKIDSQTSKQHERKPPSFNHFKINVDVVVQNNKQERGLRVVIRNSSGKVIAAAIKNTFFHGNVSFLKAQVVEWGLEVAKKVNLNNLIVETYCSEVADLANNKINNRTKIWWTISKIQKSNKDFQSLVLQYVPRQCNAIAHSLAKRALKSLDTVIWSSEYLVDVLSLFSKPVE